MPLQKRGKKLKRERIKGGQGKEKKKGRERILTGRGAKNFDIQTNIHRWVKGVYNLHEYTGIAGATSKTAKYPSKNLFYKKKLLGPKLFISKLPQ